MRRGGEDEMMLLDTCGLLWFAHEQEKMRDEALQRIDASSVVYVSAITSFEIGVKGGHNVDEGR